MRGILTQLAARRVLLVTSAAHMPRAVKTFEKVWAGSGLELIPVTTDVRSRDRNYFTLSECLPSPGALFSVTKAIKEFAGLLILTIM